MEQSNFIEKLAAPLQLKASVQNVFGQPLTVGEKVIIPVAQVAFGFGGGTGKSKPGQEPDTKGEGMGGGGGMYARPKGVYEVTPTGTRFVPVDRTRQLLAVAVVGFVIGAWWARGQ